MNKIYIHYGNNQYYPEMFRPIQNREMFVKPHGGLWASDVKDEYGWKDWNEVNEFMECNEDNSFKFTLKDNAKILEINNVSDLNDLPKLNSILPDSFMWVFLDFEKILEDGYDAIKYNLSKDGRLYHALYGWDCDSLLVLNPECVVPIE